MNAHSPPLHGIARYAAARAAWRRLLDYVRAWASEPDDADAAREILWAAREAHQFVFPNECATPRFAGQQLAALAKRVSSADTPATLRAPWAPVLLALADLCDAYMVEQQDRDARAWQQRMAD